MSKIRLVPYFAIGIVLIAVIWGFAYRSVEVEREQKFAQSAERATRLAAFFEKNVLEIVRYSDTYLSMARRVYLEHGSVDAVQHMMDAIPLNTTILSHITIIDKTGTPLMVSGHKIKPGTTAKDRDYFLFQKNNLGDEVFISLPRRGRNTGKLTIRLVRRISLADGSFGGVMFAAIDVANITNFSNAMNLGAKGSATLVGTDKKIRARSSYGRVGPGQDISGSRIWRELAASPVGLYKQRSVVDDVTRFYAYRLLQEFPLIVAIGVATDDISAAINSYQDPVYFIAILLSLIIAVMTAAVCREIFRAHVDIERRKVSEAELRAGEARFRHAFENAPIGMTLLGLDGNRIKVNQAMADFLGYSVEALTKTNLTETDADTNALEESNRQRQRVLDGEIATFRNERSYRHSDGHIVWSDVYGSLFRDDDGVAEYFIVHSIDMTEVKQAAEKLSRAQRLEAVGQLTGGVAHDFNNILAAIIGHLDLIETDTGPDSPSKASIEIAIRAASRGAELTSRLLAFSRQQPLKAEQTQINEMLPQFQQFAERTISEDIVIELNLDQNLWQTVIDVGQLENALLNLVINARDAMPEGGRLIIETANRELSTDDAAEFEDLSPGDYVMVAVSDNGSGMAGEVKARAFEPFFTTKNVGDGSGLGLSTVYGFLKQSGGQVAIESEVGHGATVRIYLPKSDVVEKIEVIALDVTSEIPVGREVVLLVEDDEDIRNFVAIALERLGYTVHVAEDGPKAVEIMKSSGQIDLLLSDVILPNGMNGRDVADAFLEFYPSAAVLFSSGYTREVLNRRGGFDDSVDLLVKPYTVNDLGARVRGVLDN